MTCPAQHPLITSSGNIPLTTATRHLLSVHMGMCARPRQSFHLPGHNDYLRLDISLVWTNGNQVRGFCQGRGALSTSDWSYGVRPLGKPEKEAN